MHDAKTGLGWTKVGAGALAALLVVSAMGWVPVAGLQPAKGGTTPVAVTPPSVPIQPPVTPVQTCEPPAQPIPPAQPTPPVTPPPAEVALPVVRANGAQGPIEVVSLLSHEKMFVGGDGQLWVRCGVKVGSPADLPAKEPVRMVLILDVSGSMSGAMPLLREATLGVARRLSAEDQLTIVTYSNDARMVFSGNPVNDAAALEAAVGRIGPEGGTNIGSGLELAKQLMAGEIELPGDCDGVPKRSGAVQKDGRLPRVLLLTDGLANQGITTSEGLSQLVSAIRAQGAPVSCMGLGSSYNEQLLAQLSDVGGGRYHYVDQAQALERVYAAELDQARRTVAQSAKLRLEAAPGMRVAEVVSWSWSQIGEGAVVDLGSLSAGRELKVLARLEPSVGKCGELAAATGVRQAVTAHLDWTAPTGRALTGGTITLPGLSLATVATAEEARTVAELAEDLKKITIAREVALARDEAKAGRGDHARLRLERLKSEVMAGEDMLELEMADGVRRGVSLRAMAAGLAAPGAECDKAAKELHAAEGALSR